MKIKINGMAFAHSKRVAEIGTILPLHNDDYQTPHRTYVYIYEIYPSMICLHCQIKLNDKINIISF